MLDTVNGAVPVATVEINDEARATPFTSSGYCGVVVLIPTLLLDDTHKAADPDPDWNIKLPVSVLMTTSLLNELVLN